uniref:HNH endonuclease family protein n=1 Tax=Amycolatopsis sp. CA-096443 TaxID=3239919 RepID=UPI003F499BBF
MTNLEQPSRSSRAALPAASRPRIRAAALAACALAAIAAMAAQCTPPSSADAPRPSALAVSAGDPASARAALSQLTVAPRGPGTGYTDDKFPHWDRQPAAGPGCDTRKVVLRRAGTDVHVDGQCRPTSGTWVSPYDGATWTRAADLDIDHVVPRKHAWETGAATWTQQRREAFANDLANPELVAVTGKVNRQKGDKAPDQWKPPSTQDWCAYAKDWTLVKKAYGLTVTPAEKTALASMLGKC